MATAPPPGPAQPTPPQLDNSPQSLSWEGEKMSVVSPLSVHPRGFRKTARELMAEAEISPDSNPPINARQGLLFEWWSVFWVLFTAKANGHGSDEAMLYTQHQANQLLQRQANQRMQPPTGQAPPTGQPPPPGMPHQQPPPMTRAPNGVTSRPGMIGFPPNGPMPNGVGPPPGSMPPSGPTAFMPQPNGIPGQPGPPLQGVPPGQGQGFQPMPGGQRASIGGMPQQLQQQPQQQPPPQRGPNPNNGPFQSPNMATSPQNPPGPPQHSQQHPQPMGPSPHLLNRGGGGGMLPPNQGMNPMNPQNPPYPQMGRSPSRAATPGQGQGAMMHPSPSMTNRQPPGSMQMPPDALNTQLMALPQALVSQIKTDLNIEARDIASFSSTDKGGNPGGPPDNAAAGPSNPMIQMANQQRNNNPQQRNQPPPPQQQQQQQRGKRNSTSPGEEHDSLPRNESSPPDRKRVRRSPMEQPAVPMNYNPQQQQPQQQGPQGHPQPGPMMMNQPAPGMMMRGPGPGPPGPGPMGGMNGGGPGGPHPGQSPMGGGPMNMNMGMGQPPMGMGGMQPHMGSGGGMPPQMHPGSITSHMQNQQMRGDVRQHQQQMLPKGPQPGGMGNMNAGSPPSTDPTQFNLGGGGGPGFNQNRMGQKSMMPPPSPAMNGPPKDQKPLMPGGGLGNQPKNPHQNPGMPTNHGSPRNPPPGPSNNAGQTPNVNGAGPSTPAPGQNQVQNQNQGGPGPGQGQGPPQGSMGSMAPSPSAILGGGGPASMLGSQDLFSSDFIQSVAGSLDDFDSSFLQPTGDINFERDFGQWFNPDDAMSGLDMK
ncbi:hypothetical protein DXG01_015287 [Tephrocybe rancida]|nr:hypothetical protein DXG01_015287 [Tephrocybe rancida]